MPTPSSNFSRYKIPDVINPSGICCICVPVPDSREYKAQFMGAIWRMSLQTHYERDDAHSGQLVAAVWREIWEDLQVSNCGCSETSGIQNVFNANLTNTLIIQAWMQTWIDAGLDIDVAFPETPDLFDSDPGDPAPLVDQRTRALCIAVESWVDELMNRGISYVEEAGVIVGGQVAAGFVLPLVPVYITIGAFVVGVFALSELASQLMDTAYRDYLKCGMYEALKGKDTNSPTDFAESWDSLPARPPPPESVFQDVARDGIEAWGRSQLNNVDNYLGFIVTLNRAMGIASALTDADCPCISGWEHQWLDGFGLGDWDVIPYDIHPVGSYDPIEDRVDGGCITDDGVGVRMSIDFPLTTITQVLASVSFFGNRASVSNRSFIGETGDLAKWGFCPHGLGPGVDVCDTGVIASPQTNLTISNFMATFACAGHYARITKIIVRGTGVNPF